MTEKSKTKQAQHVRVYLGSYPIKLKESANPAFKTNDGEFIRQGQLNDQFQGFIEAFNKNQTILKENWTIQAEKNEDVEKRLEIVEEVMNKIVKPSHRREKVKESKEVSKEPVEIPQDPEMAQKILEMEKEAKLRGVK